MEGGKRERQIEERQEKKRGREKEMEGRREKERERKHSIGRDRGESGQL